MDTEVKQFSDGRRMQELAERLKLKPKALASLMGVHYNSVYAWYDKVDLDTKIIKKFCDEVWRKELYKFFAPDNIVFSKLEPGEKEVLELFHKAPEEIKPLVVRALSSVIEFADKAVEIFRKRA